MFESEKNDREGHITMSNSNVLNVKEMAEFISNINRHLDTYIGYCGTDKNEIEETLLNDFSDFPLEQSFVSLKENGRLIGLLGIDMDQDTREGELWGPFIQHEDWDRMADLLWEQLLNQLPVQPIKIYGFYHIMNRNGKRLMERHQGSKTGEHSILSISSYELEHDEKYLDSLQHISDEYHEDFITLHNACFPATYYSAEEILSRLNHEEKLFVSVVNDELCGYVFCEANPVHGEGEIHYIAVSSSVRAKGIGRALLLKGLQFLFSFEEIQNISLCVNTDNLAAMKLYQSSGFKEKYRLYSFEVVQKVSESE